MHSARILFVLFCRIRDHIKHEFCIEQYEFRAGTLRFPKAKVKPAIRFAIRP